MIVVRSDDLFVRRCQINVSVAISLSTQIPSFIIPFHSSDPKFASGCSAASRHCSDIRQQEPLSESFYILHSESFCSSTCIFPCRKVPASYGVRPPQRRVSKLPIAAMKKSCPPAKYARSKRRYSINTPICSPAISSCDSIENQPKQEQKKTDECFPDDLDYCMPDKKEEGLALLFMLSIPKYS